MGRVESEKEKLIRQQLRDLGAERQQLKRDANYKANLAKLAERESGLWKALGEAKKEDFDD